MNVILVLKDRLLTFIGVNASKESVFGSSKSLALLEASLAQLSNKRKPDNVFSSSEEEPVTKKKKKKDKKEKKSKKGKESEEQNISSPPKKTSRVIGGSIF